MRLISFLVSVSPLRCGNCARGLEQRTREILSSMLEEEELASIVFSVDLPSKTATLSFRGNESLREEVIPLGEEIESRLRSLNQYEHVSVELIHNEQNTEREEKKSEAYLRQFDYVLPVMGLGCQRGCADALQHSVERLQGVDRVLVDFSSSHLAYSGSLSPQFMSRFIESLGFRIDDSSNENDEKRPRRGALPTRFASIQVTGLNCGGCAKKLRALIEPICVMTDDIDINLETKIARFHTTECLSKIREVIEATGKFSVLDMIFQSEPLFREESPPSCSTRSSESSVDRSKSEKRCSTLDSGSQYSMLVGGMTCGSCSSNVSRALASLSGVTNVEVALMTGKVTFSALDSLSKEDIVKTISDIGYTVSDLRITCKSPVGPCSLLQTRSPFHTKTSRRKLFEFVVSGMTCSSCVSHVEQAIRSVGGIENVNVNLSTSLATFNVNDMTNRDDEQKIIRLAIESIKNAGYDARLLHTRRDGDVEAALSSGSDDDDENEKEHIARLQQTTELQSWKRKLFISFPSGVILFFLMILEHVGGAKEFLMSELFPGLTFTVFCQFLLATPVHFIAGWSFYVKAVKMLRRCTSNMDVLVFMGANAPYCYSVVMTVVRISDPSRRDAVFFEVSALFLFFLAVGKYIETYAKGSTSGALVHLMRMQPEKALVVHIAEESPEDGVSTSWSSLSRMPHIVSERRIPASRVLVGSVVKVVPGDKIPVDGEIIFGYTSTDESMLTGESVPVSKQVGDRVFAGSMNCDGSVLIRCLKRGRESALAQMINLVESAQNSKAPIQRFADRIASIFVPIVVGISVLTLLTWLILGVCDAYPSSWREQDGHSNTFLFGFLFSITVLVISCPCALGLATPTAVMVGTGVGARLGILIKGGEPLETFHRASVIVFDKTGTLTTGRFSVENIRIFQSKSPAENSALNSTLSEDMLLSLLASAESSSEHSVAKSIVDFARQRQIPVLSPIEFTNFPGRGLLAKVPMSESFEAEQQVYEVVAGKPSFLLNHEFVSKLPEDMNQWISSESRDGKTIVAIVVDSGRYFGVVSLADTPRPESQSVISQLHEAGLRCFMLTGDNAEAASFIARRVGISPDCIFANVLPGDKSNMIQRLRDAGEIVAFVGDGVNDAPALTAASVGIAIGSGTDVALEAASIVLMKSSLQDVVVAQDIARRTFRRIQFNYLWALIYNVLAIPLAAGLFFPVWSVRIPPFVAGLAMVLSSISVVVSSLLLRWYTPPSTFSGGRPSSTRSASSHSKYQILDEELALPHSVGSGVEIGASRRQVIEMRDIPYERG